MTLVLAVPWGVYTDSKISAADGVKCDPLKKCASNHALVAGFAGDWAKIIKACEAVAAGEEDPRELGKFGVDGLVVKQARIFLIDCGRVTVRRKSTKFYCTGTGWAEGNSFMHGMLAAGKSVTHSTIEKTFKHVFKVRDDCGGQIHFLPG